MARLFGSRKAKQNIDLAGGLRHLIGTAVARKELVLDHAQPLLPCAAKDSTFDPDLESALFDNVVDQLYIVAFLDIAACCK
jgi:hypothetical protein